MKNIVSALVMIFILYSCGEFEKTIDWETQDVPATIIVEGGITNELKYQQIRLTKSDDYFINKPLDGISGAIVTVLEDNDVYMFRESDTIPGNYISEKEFAGIPGKHYSLDIQTPDKIGGKNNFKANSELARGLDIIEATAELYENPFAMEDEPDSLIVFLILNCNEPKQSENYFYLKLYRNGQAINDTIDKYVLANNDYLYGDNKNYLAVALFEDFLPDDTLSVELHSISKNYYRFIEGAQQISNLSDPFGFNGPPANAVGNINNGEGLGFFVAEFISRSTAIIQDMRDNGQK